MTEVKTVSRSEREAHIKDRAGWVITVLAALLAVNTYISNNNSSKVLGNTIKANDTWAFYQAKSIKQTAYEIASQDAADRGNKTLANKYADKAASYETDPVTGEGKRELMAQARALEAERDAIRKTSPWFTFAGSAFQLAIVLLTASILAVSMAMFWASVGVGSVAVLLMSQGLWMWLPL
jgi:hypothetical protein